MNQWNNRHSKSFLHFLQTSIPLLDIGVQTAPYISGLISGGVILLQFTGICLSSRNLDTSALLVHAIFTNSAVESYTAAEYFV